MSTVIYYYTGTGNSLWAARTLAGLLSATGSVSLHPLSPATVESRADCVGILFPVHIWGVPRRVIAFVEKLRIMPQAYCFAVAVNAGQVAATLLQLHKRMQARGLSLSSGFEIGMPSNYIPWGGPGPVELQKARCDGARARIAEASACISGREPGPVEKGPWWQRIVFTAIYKMTLKQVHKMDKDFWCDERCNACGICARICPAKNIELKEGIPAWQHHCEQCLACIQWCPQQSIQFGKKTPAYERYRHPDMLAQWPRP